MSDPSPTNLADEAPASVLDGIPQALDDLRDGRMIVLVDDEDRENEGDLVCAAQFVTPQIINFMEALKQSVAEAQGGAGQASVTKKMAPSAPGKKAKAKKSAKKSG